MEKLKPEEIENVVGGALKLGNKHGILIDNDGVLKKDGILIDNDGVLLNDVILVDNDGILQKLQKFFFKK